VRPTSGSPSGDRGTTAVRYEKRRPPSYYRREGRRRLKRLEELPREIDDTAAKAQEALRTPGERSRAAAVAAQPGKPFTTRNHREDLGKKYNELNLTHAAFGTREDVLPGQELEVLARRTWRAYIAARDNGKRNRAARLREDLEQVLKVLDEKRRESDEEEAA